MSELQNILNFRPTLPERKSFEGTLQTAWDSTSLGEIQTCAYKYYLSIICGFVPTSLSPHLRFGLVYASAIELYARNRARDLSHEDCILESIRHALTATWEARLNRPWASDHLTKNRPMLIRALIEYFDKYTPETENFPALILPDGTPAVELSFTFETNYKTPFGGNYKICGHLDRLSESENRKWVLDQKTTSMPLNAKYWQQFEVSDQVNLYFFAGQIIFPDRVAGLIIDATQITDKEINFERREINKTPAVVEEWYKEVAYWISFAEMCSKQSYWPKNRKSCMKGFMACEYIEICGKCPNVRETWMKSGFGKRAGAGWDPLISRDQDA